MDYKHCSDIQRIKELLNMGRREYKESLRRECCKRKQPSPFTCISLVWKTELNTKPRVIYN